MEHTRQSTMKALAIDRFGGMDTVKTQELPTPEPNSNQVLVKVEYAGIGFWDIAEREGMFAARQPRKPEFPYILGSEGAGEVVAVGSEIQHLKKGDRVFGLTIGRMPKSGFFAEYVVLDVDRVWPLPGKLDTIQAGTLPVDGATAVRGLQDVLKLRQGESLMIFGASGGIGHMAIQFAKKMGVRVFSIASGEDGVELARRLGSDQVVEGHSDNFVNKAKEFAPEGFDAALVTSGKKGAEEALTALRNGGRAAYPNGIKSAPQVRSGISIQNFNADYDKQIMDDMIQWIQSGSGSFEVKVDKTFSLDQAAEALKALEEHYIGRIAFKMR